MKTLVIRTPDVVSYPDNFKRMGFMNIRYTADLATIDPAKPVIMGVRGGPFTTVNIEGATLYRVSGNGAVIDTANPVQNTLTWDVNQVGSAVHFAFIPTKAAGYVRISNQDGNRFTIIQAPMTANNAVKILIEPSELRNPEVLFQYFAVPAGYKVRYTFTGDVNGFSSNRLKNFEIDTVSEISTSFNHKYWSKPLPSTLTNFSVINSKLEADIDFSIFDNATPGEIRVGDNRGVKIFGNINHVLTNAVVSIISNNYSHDGITGSLNSLGTKFTQINANIPNLTGGYTTRAFTMTYANLKINAPKVAASDWDLLLSDFANKAPNLTSGVIQVNKRTAASDANVAALAAKGISIIVGF